MTADPTSPTTDETLALAFQLLRQAAAKLWEQASLAGPRSSLHVTALGVHLAACQTHELVPEGTRLDDIPVASSSPADIVSVAERAIGAVPNTAAHPGLTTLLVTVSDLARELRTDERRRIA